MGVHWPPATGSFQCSGWWGRDAAVLVSSPMQFLAPPPPPSPREAKQASLGMLSQRTNPLLQGAGGRTPTISGPTLELSSSGCDLFLEVTFYDLQTR